MSKEYEERMKRIKDTPGDLPFEDDDANWLTEQVEENKRLREALEFYADKDKWTQQHIENNSWTVPKILRDNGSVATKALEDKK